MALLITLITFAPLITVWSVVGYYEGNHPAVSRIVDLDRYGRILVPFVLIGLGIYIILNGG